MAAKYGISVHHRKVAESSLSFIMPQGRQARHRPLPRRPLPASGAAAQPRGLPGPASRRPPGRRRDALCQRLPRGRHPHLPRRRRPALEHPRASGVHRRGHRGRAPVRADEPVAGRDAGLPQEPRRPDRRRHPGRARPRLVRRERPRGHPAGARRAARAPWWTPTAPATSSTAPTCTRPWHGRSCPGASTSSSPAPPRPTRSSISATRRACRPSRTSHAGAEAPTRKSARRGPASRPLRLAHRRTRSCSGQPQPRRW